MKYQGKTAIPSIVSIGGNPRRTLSISMFLVMMSRVTKNIKIDKVRREFPQILMI